MNPDFLYTYTYVDELTLQQWRKYSHNENIQKLSQSNCLMRKKINLRSVAAGGKYMMKTLLK